MSENRVKTIVVFLTQTEFEVFMKGYEESADRSKSAYGRKLLLGKPVTIKTRNRSVDDFIEIAVKLRKDLKILLSKETFTGQEKEALKKEMYEPCSKNSVGSYSVGGK